MNKNLYYKELKRNRKSLIIWSSIVIAFTVLVLCLFPFMKEIGDDMASMMSNLPEGMTEAMGINEQTFNSILGMYKTYYVIYIVVLLAIYTASTAANILTKEEKDKTSEFLLTKPISRKSIFNTKLVALLSLCLIAYAAQTLTAFVFVKALGEEGLSWSIFTAMHVHGLFLILFFTCIGLLISMIFSPKTNFMGPVVGIVFGSYFINTIAKVSDSASWLGYLSPFYYLNFEITDLDFKIDYINVSIILLLSMLLVFLAYKLFEKKDMNA